jgi:hypothetical protein
MYPSTIVPDAAPVIDGPLVRRLQEQNSAPSVSLLLTTTPGSALVTRDVIHLYQLLDQAHRQLGREPDVDDTQTARIIEFLRRLAFAARRGPATSGLALYASDVHAEAVHLPVSVQDRVVIDPTFATRDLVRALQAHPRYRLLVLAQRGARLFEGRRDRLKEVVTEAFPVIGQQADHRADRSHRFGRDRSDGRDAALRAQLRSIDAALAARYAGEPLPLVVSGVRRQLALFRAATTQKQTMIGQILGSHGRSTPVRLVELAKPHVRRFQQSCADRAMTRLRAGRDRGRLVEGIDEVWAAAAESRVGLLCVEESYVLAARVTDGGRQLEPIPDIRPGALDDAIDELLEMVSLDGGEVMLVQDGVLQAERRVAALLS